MGRNDPCWCGSGKKFKKCHALREGEQRLPFRAIEQAARNEWREKTCLHPEAGAGRCGKVINAHTIQRSGVLGRLTNAKNQVLTFFQVQPNDQGKYVPRAIGWRDASTFTGFCSNHDSVFSPLEIRTFTREPEQLFLVGYRAICHEMYQKSASLRANPVLRELIDRGLPPDTQRRVQHIMKVMAEGVRSGLEWAGRTKGVMDKELLASDFNALSWWIVEFEGALSVASTGAVSPNYDLAGRELQRLHDVNSELQPLLFGTVATEKGGGAIFGWRPNHSAPRRFVDSLADQGTDNLASAIVQFMFAHIENTYFSEEWWLGLSDDLRKLISTHAMNSNPYYQRPRYAADPLVPWKVISSVRAGAA